VTDLLARSAAAILEAQALAIAFVLAAFFSLATRAAVLLLADRGRGWPVATLRGVAAVAFLGLGWVYGLFTARMMRWTLASVGMMAAAAAVVFTGLLVRTLLKRPPPRPGPTALLAQLSALLALLLVAAVTLMTAGFLALTTDRAVLLVDVTGETSVRSVSWAPPDQPMREEALTTHRVVFRTPEGAAVGEAWMYGDQVAVKGRVLRLSPVLNAAGIPNLFELEFAHNGYLTAERHSAYPHEAVPLPPIGPLAVHPWWRPLQRRILERWERGAGEGSGWTVRSATIESTYFPLVDAQGRPVRKTFRLVLTPGGLSAG
jgi:hypothetical protein